MVKIFLGVTHRPWFTFLAQRSPDEVNFWQPSGSGMFRALQPGELFLFKLKGTDLIAGGGVFGHASLAPLSLAWEAFGERNGADSLAEMRRIITLLRHVREPLGDRDDPTIGCRVLLQPFFWPRDQWFAVPTSFSPNTVVGKTYGTDDADGLRLWHAVQERFALLPHAAAPEAEDRYGAPSPLRRRLGQGAFRLAVTDGYGRRCAVSGEKTLPILDAAHIRTFASGGAHDISNGLLLRTDIHKLFDLGYVTITNDRRFAVSERLKRDFDNGVHYYAMQGREISGPRPGFAPPSLEMLQWHRENRYRG